MTRRRRDGRQPGQRIDWTAVRASYVEGTAQDPDGDPTARSWPTLAEVAAYHGIAERTVDTRSMREGWVAQRDAFRADVERRRREALAEETAQKVGSIDRRGLTAADAGLALIGHRMTFLVRAELARGQEAAGQGVVAQELAALGLAARRWVQVRDQVVGRPVLEEGEDLERDLRVAEQVLAAKLAQRRAGVQEDDDLEV